MDEVGILLDSIEAQDESIAFSLEKGTSYDDYSTRLQDINDYIENSKMKVMEMEELLQQSEGKNQALAAMVSKYRRSIEEKEQKIAMLTEQVDKYRVENQSLIKTVDLQNQELKEREKEIEAKRAELSALESDIERMMAEAKQAEADAYFARAESTVEMANRTKFAPKKKKETLKIAYDLYKLAFESGREDAYAKMEELEGEL
jgi:chromosome segregation ATPase